MSTENETPASDPYLSEERVTTEGTVYTVTGADWTPSSTTITTSAS